MCKSGNGNIQSIILLCPITTNKEYGQICENLVFGANRKWIFSAFVLNQNQLDL